MTVESLVKFGFSYPNEFPSYFILIALIGVVVCVGLVVKLSISNPYVFRKTAWSFSPIPSKPILPSSSSVLYKASLPITLTPEKNSCSNNSSPKIDNVVESIPVLLEEKETDSFKPSHNSIMLVSPSKASLSQAEPTNEVDLKNTVNEKISHIELSQPTYSTPAVNLKTSQNLSKIVVQKTLLENETPKPNSHSNKAVDHSSHQTVDITAVDSTSFNDFIPIESRRRRKPKKSQTPEKLQAQTNTDNKMGTSKHQKQIRRRQKPSSTESSPRQSPTSSPRVPKAIPLSSIKRSENTSTHPREPRTVLMSVPNVHIIPNTKQSPPVTQPLRATTFVDMGYDFQPWYSPFTSGFHLNISKQNPGQRQPRPNPYIRPKANFTPSHPTVANESVRSSHSNVMKEANPNPNSTSQFSLFDRGF